MIPEAALPCSRITESPTAVSSRTSQRALIAVSSPDATLAHSGLQALDEPTVRAVVRQAVRDVRTAPPPPPAGPPADPTVTALRRAVDDLTASTHAIGELMLEVAPAYLSDTDNADVLALLFHAIGEPLEHGLAARRYAASGDGRALHGTLPVAGRGRRAELRTSDEGDHLRGRLEQRGEGTG
ncbi:hypothetical protein [Streptomyces sp. NPDC052701]|uniref:hypothetical protein n=1 Tax=Streptomyces sp. NPDC052701 TaxID=3155533 RepID=UPI003449201E